MSESGQRAARIISTARHEGWRRYALSNGVVITTGNTEWGKHSYAKASPIDEYFSISRRVAAMTLAACWAATKQVRGHENV